MKRLLVMALVVTIGQASAAFAGESLLTSGARHAQALAVPVQAPTPEASITTASPASVAAYQGGGSTLSKSGMSKSKKALIYIGLAVGFAASAWTIDHHVLDVTPSSLGTRKD